MSAVEFKGEEFEPKGAVNRMRTLYLSKVARDNQKRLKAAERSQDNEAIGEAMMHINAALYELIQSVLRPDDFDRFMVTCDEQGVSDQELYAFAGEMMGAAAAYPTEQPTDSSDGPSTTQESSVSRLEIMATERFPGRPDLVMAATAVERVDGDLWSSMAG